MKNKAQKRSSIFLPFIIALSITGGVYLGQFWSKGPTRKTTLNFTSSSPEPGKLDHILDFIERKYVDTINKKELSRKAINKVLNDLDPHSSYIPKEQLKTRTESLEGNFDGIGIQFLIKQDTVTVVTPVPGGPSESLGIKPGDRIVKVNGKDIAGTGITNRRVIELLRGKKGTKVDVSIYREGKDSLLDYTITRGEIPLNSVDVGMMTTNKMGYIKISRFAQTTHEEFKEKATTLKAKGMEKLILDLRGNGGGYLSAAIAIADEVLKEGEMILYTEGKAHPKKVHRATPNGSLEEVELAVLIDGGSASASEIVAGAIQDNDRGTIVGRRSFGKGLVQEQIELPNGGALRLTVARYHTPTGRCIQKPYGEDVDYHEDIADRYREGELLDPDSIEFPDSLKYSTDEGDVVYGGGGIMPDIFVPIDTTRTTELFGRLSKRGILNEFAFAHADKNREQFKNIGLEGFIDSYEVNADLLSKLGDFAVEKGVDLEQDKLQKASPFLKNRIKALISRNIWDEEGYYPIALERDPVFGEAKKVLNVKRRGT